MQNEKKTKKSLAAVCIPENLSRRNYFSDTYTTVMSVNGEKRQMDVTHIRLPFTSSREKVVMSHFGMGKDEMHDLYGTLARCISNTVNVTSFLNSRGVPSVMRIYRSEIKKNSGSTDIYLITEHLRPMTEVYFKEETTVANILNFGVRTANLIRDVHAQSNEVNVTIRCIDPEQIFVDNNGRFVFGCFQYAYITGSAKPPILLAPTAPFHVPVSISSQGKEGDLGTDMTNLATILWALFNGDGFDQPTTTGNAPKYGNSKIEQILKLGMEGDPEMFQQFKSGLSELYKGCRRDNTGNTEVPIFHDKPCLPPLDTEDQFGIESEVNVPDHEQPETSEPEIAQAPAAAEQTLAAEAEQVQESPDNQPVNEQEQAAPAAEDKEQEYQNEKPVPDEEPLTSTVSILDTSAYVAATEPACEMEPQSYEEGMEFVILYHKPKFFLRQLLVLLATLIVIGGILYLSIRTHMITLW